jgi:outer membrane receptor protein involved in Fe transport
LQRIPGIQVGQDSLGVLGIGIRGRWSAEGRILMLIDGQPFTEPMYGASMPEGRIPLDLVQRVEILRGAASARYGGGASAAVINIVTVAGAGPGGAGIHAEACARPTGLGCAGVSGSFVVQGDRTRIAGHAYGQYSSFSAGTYEDFWGTKLDIGRTDYTVPNGLALHVGRDDLHFQIGMEAQERKQTSGFDEVQEAAAPNNFQLAWARLSSATQLTDRWLLTPKAELSMHRPWNTEGKVDPHGYLWYDRMLSRAGVEAGLLGDIGPRTQLDLGAGGHVDWILSGPQWEAFPLPTERRSAVYGTAFSRAELLWVGPGVNVAAGMRAEYAAPVGLRFAPRLALTSAGELFHAKLLVSSATRAPTYEQVFANADLESERGGEVELELGARPVTSLQLRSNVFFAHTRNPIVYAIIDNWDSYWNAEPSTTAGAEAEVAYRSASFGADLSYALYKRIGSDDEYWIAPGHDDRRAAFSPMTGTAQVRWSPVDRVWLSPSARVLGPRTVWTGVDEDDELVASDLPPAVLLDVGLRFERIADHFDITLTAHDLLGQDPGWHQPYAGWHAPLPGRGRELVLKLGWTQ